MNSSKENYYTIEKLKKAITKLNTHLNNNDISSTEEKDKKIKKIIEYLNEYSQFLKNSESDELKILEYLNMLFNNLADNVFILQGDELMENLWKLYYTDTQLMKFSPTNFKNKFNKSGNTSLEINNNPEYFLNLIFMNENFTLKIINEKIIEFEKENSDIKFDFPLNQIENILIEMKTEILEVKSKINKILDLIMLKILCNGNIKTFYTVLSSMLMLTEGKTVLVFKLISFFALCLWKFPNKESFIGSLLFIIGGMLRDYAKSYLNTKGIQRNQFFDHKCNHKDHDRQFFKVSILNNDECIFLEDNFFDIIKEFLSIIIYSTYTNLEKLTKWDNFKQIFVKYIYLENMDIEESLPPHIQIIQYFTLFIADFLFTFICGFCGFDSETNQLKTQFKNFDNFAIFCFNFLTKTFTNIFSVLDISQRKINFFQIDCEKTEYILTDKFNTYGVYFLVLIAMNYTFNENTSLFLDNSTRLFLSENPNKFIPLILSKEYIGKELIEILENIISIEKEKDMNFCLFYKDIIKGYNTLLVDMITNIKKSKINENEKMRKLYSSFVLNIYKLDKNERDGKLIGILFDLFEDKINMLIELTKHIDSQSDYVGLLNYFFYCNSIKLFEEKNILISLLLTLTSGIKSGYILESHSIQKLNEFFEQTKNSSKLTYEIAIKDLLEDINNEDNSPQKLEVKLKLERDGALYESLRIGEINKKSEILLLLDSFIKIIN